MLLLMHNGAAATSLALLVDQWYIVCNVRSFFGLWLVVVVGRGWDLVVGLGALKHGTHWGGMLQWLLANYRHSPLTDGLEAGYELGYLVDRLMWGRLEVSWVPVCLVSRRLVGNFGLGDFARLFLFSLALFLAPFFNNCVWQLLLSRIG